MPLLGTEGVVSMVTATKTDRESVGQRVGGKEAILTSTKALLAKQT